MWDFIDNYLNRITMYRLVLYTLIFLVIAAIPLSALNKLPFSPVDLLYSVITILIISIIINKIFSWAFNAPTNVESVYISALILVLIVTPKTANDPLSYLSFVFWVSALAMVSKYFMAIGKKHIFNPVAIAVVLTAITFNQSPSWWVGNLYMAPFVALTGFLVIRKIRRADLVISFLLTASVVTIVSNLITGSTVSPLTSLYQILFQSPVLFLAVFMLTEPLTTPPTREMRIAYGALVGLFFIPIFHIGSLYFTPELSLVLGNIFSYLTSPKEKLFLKLKEKVNIANDIDEFSFIPDRKFSFFPGQYLEWTLPHRSPDNRGNRRYFTIASSPTEKILKLGVKFYPELSSFKNKLFFLKPGASIIASQRAGEFILPEDKSKKLVFIAGGIGITPFRSMIKYCVDTNEKRDIVLLYSNKTVKDIAYKEIFDEAAAKISLKTLYIVSSQTEIIRDKSIYAGSLDAVTILNKIPDYKERIFYISGPHTMVVVFKKLLSDLGIEREKIKTDFFPGFA